jgi:hypothetical protein
MKERWKVVFRAIACILFFLLFVRSWVRESNRGPYFMTFGWGALVLFHALFLYLDFKTRNDAD